MTDKEVLQKAIEIAIKNGYKEPFMFGMGSDFSLDKFHVFKLYFSHDFAKAFFGEPKDISPADIIMDNKTLGYIPYYTRGWQYHLRQMVLEEKPIDYLRKFIDTTENPTNDESSEVKGKSQIKGEELEDKSIEKIMEYKSVSGITIEDIYPKHGFIIDKLNINIIPENHLKNNVMTIGTFSTKSDLNKRKGILIVNSLIYDNFNEEILELIFNNFYPQKIERNYSGFDSNYKMYGYSKLFDVVKDGEAAPEYDFVFIQEFGEIRVETRKYKK